MRRGIRFRLVVTLLGLVAVVVASISVGTYAFVEARLRAGLLDQARQQAQFDLSVLLPGRLEPNATRADFEASGLPASFRLRGDADLMVDFGDGDPYVAPASLLGVFQALPAALVETVQAGHLGYAWQPIGDRESLIVGGREADGPAVYLVVDGQGVADALDQLRVGLAAAGLIALLVTLATAGLVARRILRPIASGSAAAARIAAGDLAARVNVEGEDELAGWAAEFNRMADSLATTIRRLEQSQQQNRRFVADVSHELRTPMTALVAEASLIESKLDRLDQDGRRAAELLVADVRRLRSLVDDLMELSRFDAAAEAVVLEPVDLARVVSSIVESRLPAARLSLPSRPILIESDVRRLDRILGNILDNARVHAPGAPVEVAVAEEADDVRISVADRGPGTDAELLPRIFERFFKADPSRSASDSSTSGLGLAIASEHAALLGGTLEVAQRNGGGLTFTLTLPVTGSLPSGDGPDTRVDEDS